MNTNSNKLYGLIQDYVDELREIVQDINTTGESFCPCCLFNEWKEGKDTALMAQLYSLTKDNPEEAIYSLMEFYKFNSVVAELVEHLVKTTVDVNEPELCNISE